MIDTLPDIRPEMPEEPPLMGLAALMGLTCAGTELNGIANQLLQRIRQHPDDANALMDMSVISHLWFQQEIGLATQAQALKHRRWYRLPAAGAPHIRLLALMHDGDLAANTPLEFLVQNSDITLDMLYLDPAQAFPTSLPPHDVIFVAVGESERSRAVLALIEQHLPSFARPLLNRPERIGNLGRDSVSAMLQGIPGIAMPLSVKLSRSLLEGIGNMAVALPTAAEGGFPIIVRPVDSHAGRGLIKIDAADELAGYLQARPEQEFYLSRFVDYRSADGLYRKYRIVLVDGTAFAGHMAISAHWMIHYLNAGMANSAEKRAEEAHFIEHFNSGFAVRHQRTLQEIHRRAGLDYLVIDCAETADGKLLVFEIDSAAVVHAMDSVERFPYKQAQTQKIFEAFHALLQRKMQLHSVTIENCSI